MEWLSGLFSGAGNIIGTAMANKQSAENLEVSNQFNAQQAEEARSFNSAEALKARQFADLQGDYARQFNSNEALKSRQWTESMSNTAYQRARQDMERAGINPMVAYQQGGASAPGGASASAGAASGPSASGPAASGGMAPVHSYANAVASAIQSAQVKKVMDKLDEETQNVAEQKHLTAAQTSTQANLTVGTALDNERKRTTNQIVQEQLKIAKGESKKAELDTEVRESGVGGWARRWGTTLRDLNPLAGNAKTLHEMINGN